MRTTASLAAALVLAAPVIEAQAAAQVDVASVIARAEADVAAPTSANSLQSSTSGTASR